MPSDNLLDLFKRDLENLKDNDKYKISALTVFARDHKDEENVAESIVDLTTKHVHSIPAGLKLLGLYVIDSIVKNVGVPFRKLYTGTIVDAFVHSFQAIRDEKGRLKLYNLRTTWKDIFPNPRMYELDIRVREHDPAWPLLATPPESKSAFRSLPNIPKIQLKPELKDTNTEAGAASPKATISASRDPRLNRKRKSTAQPSSPGEEFLIDRSGDQKMESVARKQGKQESTEQPKKGSLFGGEDLDMRSQLTPPLPSPVRSVVWSSYIDKHAEICSRRELKDVDMRINTTVHSDTGSTDLAANALPPSTSWPLAVPVLGSEAGDASRQPLVQSRPISQIPMSSSQPLDANRGNCPTVRGPELTFPVPKPDLATSHALPPQICHVLNPPLFHPMRMNEPPPPVPRLLPVPSHPPFRGPPISGPMWSVEIDGFPDMVNIGVDPRMLSLVPHPKPPRRITIDGRRYSLLLDRVQPLIMVGNQVHAVRFRCELATVLIDGRCFTIPGTGFTKVMIGWRPYQAYLGGPGHELIIDGKPHTIPLGSQLTFITVGIHCVGVKFVGDLPRNVNVLPPIPPRLLKWAGQGLFGSPRSLHLVPLNPLAELSRLAEGRSFVSRVPNEVDMRPELNNRHTPDSSGFVQVGLPPSSAPNYVIQAPAPPPATDLPATMTTQAEPPVTTSGVSPHIDVHALFQKLVKAGIVTDTSAQPLPELVNYSWDRFKLPCTAETSAIYNGHQCSQCGLRFQSDLSPEFAAHLDYHYMKNSSEHDRRSRNFYQPARYWLLSEAINEGASQFDPGTPIPDLQESKCPAFADPLKNVCAVCYEKFDVFWDHDEEEWMLRDAVLLHDKVYHPICQEDAGKEFPFASNVAHDMQEVELSPSALKCEPAVAIEPVTNVPSSPSDENAFVCDDQHSTKIPGLSPVRSPTPPNSSDTASLKLDPDSAPQQPTEPEHNAIIPVHEHIKADPLAALKAVLHGGVSSLVHPPSTS